MNAHLQQLRRLRRLLWAGRLLGVLLAVAALAAALILLAGLTDAAAGFDPAGRLSLIVAVCLVSGLALIAGSVLALNLSLPKTAAFADRASQNPRRSAAAALSLDPASAPTPLGKLLHKRSLETAAADLRALPAKRVLPRRLWGFAALALALPIVAGAALFLAFPSAVSAIATRLLHPTADLPPYSPLVFQIDPAKPATVYGGEILISADITGAALEQPVECLVRQVRSGEIARLPAFRESPTRFSRKLDGVTDAIDIAFASGKARSAWHPVEILLEPQILSGLVKIEPPAYTGLAPSEFPLDTNEIAAVEGATVTLVLTSNRPLGSGVAEITGLRETPDLHEATLPATHSASFTWTALRSGRIAATLRDVRGTPTRQPLEIAFRCLPDSPPVVELASPPPMLLATPSSKIPVSGRATDDHALSRIHFTRTLAGFRDRSRAVANALRDKSFEFQETLDLDALGLEAGQTVELMLQATDHNPSLLGQGSSEISRIKIISEDEYARYLRARTTLEEFGERFRAAREAIQQAREAVEKLADAADGGEPGDIEKAAEEARKIHQHAAELLDDIAGDFPAFDLEARLQDLARQQADELRKNLEDLAPEALENDLQAAIDRMRDRLQQAQPDPGQLDEDLELIEQAGRILEMAARFRRIYDAQVSLAERFAQIVKELRLGQDQNRRLLPALGETQQKNREALELFKTELRERLDTLPGDNPHLDPLIGSALNFLQELDVAAPETLMDAAADHARAGQGHEAAVQAELARALLERLLSNPEPFPQAIGGQPPEFDVPHPDVNETLAQLLEGLLGQNAADRRGAGGAGMGGTGGSGQAASGFSTDLPVIGPERLRFQPQPHSLGGGDGSARSGPSPPLPETAETGTLPSTGLRGGDATTATPETIPEPYREAVKRFLSHDAE